VVKFERGNLVMCDSNGYVSVSVAWYMYTHIHIMAMKGVTFHYD